MDSILAKALEQIATISEAEARMETRIQALEGLLERRRKAVLALHVDVEKYKSFVEKYRELSVGEGHLPAHGFRNPKHRQRNPEGVPFRKGTSAEKIEKAVVGLLTLDREPMQIGELLDAITKEHGDIVHGARPRTVLAATLSRSQKVYYRHPDGWLLRPDRKIEADPELDPFGEGLIS